VPAGRGVALAAAEHRPDARGQLPQAERLGDVVVGADVQPADASDSLVRAVSMMIGMREVAGGA
jgi:hypothetical protein